MNNEMLSFEYYLNLPISKLGKSNIIPIMDLDDDTKLGLYYLMKIYELGFKQCSYGTWEWISLCKDKDSESLTAEQILSLPINEEELEYHRSNHNKHIYPEGYSSQNNNTEDNKFADFEYKGQFGWLSPTGEFIESNWGTHDSSAEKIVDDKGFRMDYEQQEDIMLERDYLCNVKGYVLIHNPSADGGYIVTSAKPLTKKQKEFLFDYFCAISNFGRANYYVDD